MKTSTNVNMNKGNGKTESVEGKPFDHELGLLKSENKRLKIELGMAIGLVLFMVIAWNLSA